MKKNKTKVGLDISSTKNATWTIKGLVLYHPESTQPEESGVTGA